MDGRPRHRRLSHRTHDGSCCSNLAQCLNLSAKAASLSREITRVVVSGFSLPRAYRYVLAGRRQDGWPRSPATLGVVIHVEQTEPPAKAT